MPSKQATGDKRMAQRQHRNTKLFLEDLAQQLSKTFKDAGRLRVRYNVRPNLVPIQVGQREARQQVGVAVNALVPSASRGPCVAGAGPLRRSWRRPSSRPPCCRLRRKAFSARSRLSPPPCDR